MKHDDKYSETVTRREAERRGAFAENAISEQDALESLEDNEPEKERERDAH